MTVREGDRPGDGRSITRWAFGMAATVLAVVLQLIGDKGVQTHHPIAFCILVGALPVWIMIALFNDYILDFWGAGTHSVGTQMHLATLVGLFVTTVAALSIIFGSFRVAYGWAFAGGVVISMALASYQTYRLVRDTDRQERDALARRQQRERSVDDEPMRRGAKR